MLGAAVIAVGYLIGVATLGAVWLLVVISLVIGAGIGLAYRAMPALIMGAVPASETGAGNSFNTLMRSLGTSFASAVAGVILAQLTIAPVAGRFPPKQPSTSPWAWQSVPSYCPSSWPGSFPRFRRHQRVPRGRRRYPG